MQFPCSMCPCSPSAAISAENAGWRQQLSARLLVLPYDVNTWLGVFGSHVPPCSCPDIGCFTVTVALHRVTYQYVLTAAVGGVYPSVDYLLWLCPATSVNFCRSA